MGNIYKTQDYLRIQASYTANVSSDIASVKIKYRNPNGDIGSWDATHNAASKTIYYDIPLGSPLLYDGRWTAWSYAVMNDGRILIGEPFGFSVSNEGY